MKSVLIVYLTLLHVIVAGLAYKVTRTVPGASIESVVQANKLADPTVPQGSAIFLGDSITQRLPVSEVVPQAYNYGVGGDTAQGLASEIQHYTAVKRARVVFLAIGINDIVTGRDGLEDAYRRILGEIPKDVPLVWSGIMPTSLERFTFQIHQANETIKRLCSARPGCVYVDTWKVMDKPSYFVDGVHPNAQGYARWIEALRAVNGGG